MNKLHLRETKKRNLVCMSLHVSQGHGNFPTYFINLTMSVRKEVPDSSLGLCSAACLQNHQNRHEFQGRFVSVTTLVGKVPRLVRKSGST